MTKQEYIEFLNLQEHYEWLHGAEDRAKSKLETFATDDSEFDELVREAIKVYFETEIDKAWKQIEEFKTGITFVADREDAIGYCSKKNEPESTDKTYYEFDFDTYKITLDSVMFNDAHYKCTYTDVNCNNCVLNDIPCICNELQGRYTRGEYRIIHSKEE